MRKGKDKTTEIKISDSQLLSGPSPEKEEFRSSNRQQNRITNEDELISHKNRNKENSDQENENESDYIDE